MRLNIKGFLYRLLIDPLLSGARGTIAGRVGSSMKIIDVACGPGTLAIELASRAGEVTAIDLDEDLIAYASAIAGKRGVRNIHFEARDASDLSMYADNQFDLAVTSMSVHQFEPELAVKILSEMKRIARKVILADYNHPLPASFPGRTARGIEWLAGGDHYRNFVNYMKSGGLQFFAGQAGLEIKSVRIRGNGVFMIAACW